MGIAVVADRPGVGGNLQDHLELYIQQESLQPITLYSKLNLFSKAMIGAEWLLFKSGLGATNQFESAAFVRSRAGVEYPDIQYHFLPAAIRYDGRAAAKSHGFQAHVGPMRSPSPRVGHACARADPRDRPVIRFNYMSHPEDWRDFRHAIRLTREIFAQAAFDPYRGREISPGSAVQTDAELDGFIREHVESAYHPCGTCRMGSPSDPMAWSTRSAASSASTGSARRRFLDFPAHHQRQSQRALDHDRREGGRPYSGTSAASPVEPGAVDQSALAGCRPLGHDRCPSEVSRMRAQPQASHYINGGYVEDTQGAPLPVIYPATGDTIAAIHAATPNIVELAVEAAREAQPAWARLKPVERGRILRRAADLLRARNEELARLETLDTGKAIQETRVADAASAADALEFFAGAVAAFNGEYFDLGGPFAYSKREALGICVGIGAWNYPIQGAGWKSAPALAMGNAMVFKPSENTPLSALALAEIYSEAGLPDGLFNVVQGLGDVGAALAGHPAVAKVSLTGSVGDRQEGIGPGRVDR